MARGLKAMEGWWGYVDIISIDGGDPYSLDTLQGIKPNSLSSLVEWTRSPFVALLAVVHDVKNMI